MRDVQLKLMRDFLIFLNTKSSRFVLKGGTSLMFCYGLTRFSEDIDLDGFDKQNFFNIVDLFIRNFSQHYTQLTYRRAKDTDTVKRVLIHYGASKPLKVEVSYRKKVIEDSEFCRINNILVYTIPSIMAMKLNAFNHRDKIRDLYDIVFLYTRYKNMLSDSLIFSLRDSVAYKGIEQFDYLIQNQQDDLINNDELEEQFLVMYYDLGLV